jgi:RNAse (barnase) inhibitor barstar
LTFTFKASDAMSSNVRKLWKVLETEVGLFEVEMTFVSNSHSSIANESLLRSNQIPVVLNI